MLRRARGWPAKTLLTTCCTAMLTYGCTQDHVTTAPAAPEVPTFVAAQQPLQPLGSGPGSGTQEGSARISASKGGKLNVGRFELVFAPGALLRDTEIKIVDVTNTVGHVECHLYPDGLVFLNTVTLEADFSDLANPAGHTMYWRVQSGTNSPLWVNVGGTPTSDGRGIITRLEHFSDYAPGKAGW